MESYKLNSDNLTSIHQIINQNNGFLVKISKAHQIPYDLQSMIEVAENTMVVIDTDMILRNTDAILMLKSNDNTEYIKTKMGKPKSRYVLAVKNACEIELNISFKQQRKYRVTFNHIRICKYPIKYFSEYNMQNLSKLCHSRDYYSGLISSMLNNHKHCSALSDYFIYCKLREEMIPNQMVATYAGQQIQITNNATDPLVHQQKVEQLQNAINNTSREYTAYNMQYNELSGNNKHNKEQRKEFLEALRDHLQQELKKVNNLLMQQDSSGSEKQREFERVHLAATHAQTRLNQQKKQLYTLFTNELENNYQK